MRRRLVVVQVSSRPHTSNLTKQLRVDLTSGRPAWWPPQRARAQGGGGGGGAGALQRIVQVLCFALRLTLVPDPARAGSNTLQVQLVERGVDARVGGVGQGGGGGGRARMHARGQAGERGRGRRVRRVGRDERRVPSCQPDPMGVEVRMMKRRLRLPGQQRGVRLRGMKRWRDRRLRPGAG